MLNYLRADIWKLFRGKAFYIILISILICMVLFGFLLEMTTRISYDDYIQMQEKQNGIKISTGEKVENEKQYVAYQESIRQSMNASFFMGMATSESGILYIGFTLLFSLLLLMDYTNGYLKNLISLAHAKSRWFTSKLFSAAFIALVYLASMLLVSSLYGYWRTGSLGYTMQQLLPFILGQLIAMTALGSVLLLFVVFFQQTLPVILLGLVLARNIHTLPLRLLDNLNLLPFSLAKNSLGTRIYQLTVANTDQVGRLLIHSALVILAASLAAWFYFKKRDIKC